MSRRGWLVGGMVAALLVGSVPCWIGRVVVYSLTGSMPQGWYVRAWGRSGLMVGDVVVFDVPPSMAPQMPQDVPGRRLLKRVAALAGAVVCWEEDAMRVWHETEAVVRYPVQTDRPVLTALGCQLLAPHDLVVTGTHARSYDSRYIGAIDTALVQFRVRPVWTWEGSQ